MNTFQSGVNRLLNTTAIATGAIVKYTTDKYAAERGAQYNKAYEAQVEAAQKSYTKSGAKSKSNAAKEAQAAAEAAQPGAGSKLPWLKGTEEALKGDYENKVKKLNERTAEGVKKLKETKAKGMQDVYKQFGDYQELAPQLLAKMPPEERWKLQADAKLKQQQAFDNFLKKVKGGKE